MTLTLYHHPLASFCHKVRIALLEAGTPHDTVTVDLSDPGDHARHLDLWPIGKMPVLRDDGRDRTVPESSIIIDYLDTWHPGPQPMIPADPEAALAVRLWDRFFDLHVQDPMQEIVFESFRPANRRDPEGVAQAEARLRLAWDMAERQATGRTWICGEAFTMADCAAAPALFFGGIIVPFGAERVNLSAYLDRLLARPSFRAVLAEARPFLGNFPFHHRIDARLRAVIDAL